MTIVLALGILLTVVSSMTVTSASNDRRFGGYNGITLTVPAKPTSTVYVMGKDQMYVYLKRGYQVQQVVGDPTHSDGYHYFLMVKYK